MSLIVQFTPFSSTVHPSFWHALTQFKLDVLKLDAPSVPIRASYSAGKTVVDRETGKEVGLGCHLLLGEDAFDLDAKPAKHAVSIRGTLINFNTIEEFKSSDKTALFNTVTDKLWSTVSSGSISSSPDTQLNTFLLITFADLKKYKYYYWFAFPAFMASPLWEISEAGWGMAEDVLGGEGLEGVWEGLTALETEGGAEGAWLVKKGKNGCEVGRVDQWEEFFKDVPEQNQVVAFLDPSATHNPGWPLRNLLSHLRALHPSRPSAFNILCWRDSERPLAGKRWASRYGRISLPGAAGQAQGKRPAAVGWERNVQGKLGPKLADLAPMMDPTRLANQAVDLNLKLMRWRILPDLDLDRISSTRCLLLGAGTLGCYVARTLMGWGVRTITLVDSGRVSFSNPVRQPLFDFEDCLDGGKPKAACAAEHLRKIFPGVNARGVEMTIPMPGHPIPPSEVGKVKQTVKDLEELYDTHDAVFLLMDSRESRWLPTVLGTTKNKYVLNAALGFDTYLVMRHGAREGPAPPPEAGDHPQHARLGCYYCNDIVAPSDSLTDRTLDQMCTVTRPGLAPIAASTAVELLVSMVQHPLGIHAPPSAGKDDDDRHSVLGAVPHQLRGYLARFNSIPITGAAYERCTGCSDIAVKEYEKEGFNMVQRACDETGYLEQLTGLKDLYDESDAVMEAVEWDGDDAEGDF
ncbi:E1-like protein-activating [Dacryopinax primogenitus]|uniref:Ubiquitin-like modifier-activating enzyme ATG7 n=1 Tax=Dacryopinax primogenitus (strain DJM 731) TaxID=1858805 RepID=M5GC11_DACPD|nr:E1-like protein-activating [Dacryopinax primogenitus]EJU01568.1 E1-like protein-activating [Dacryopinax primogenitus]